MNKVAILVTTFLRDDLLNQVVESMQKFCPDYRILIGDQNPSEEKMAFYQSKGCVYDAHPFNCGLSESRNRLVDLADSMGFEYVVLASDSFIFDERTRIDKAFDALQKYDLVGMFLEGCSVYWVGNLTLKQHDCFDLEFYNRNDVKIYDQCGEIKVLPCNIIHNFFVTKTSVLKTTPWDPYLVMAEHEDEFYRLQLAGVKVCWTPDIKSKKITSREGAHGNQRMVNWKLGQARLKEKYSLRKWISYKNLMLGKVPQTT